jgi:hypothetical protein
MEQKQNYQKMLNKLLADESQKGKRLLLHSCCAPCSSYVLVYLSKYFEITVFYYNPNITEDEEYRKRVAEQKRLIAVLNREHGYAPEAARSKIPAEGLAGKGQDSCREISQKKDSNDSTPDTESIVGKYYEIHVMEGDYEPDAFFRIAKGHECDPEGGARCHACYGLRLERTAQKAAEGRYDYFTTTLSISPLKDAQKLNEIGQALAAKYEVPYLPSDFKKQDGYLTSVRLSEKYGLYRQDYCGCVYSKRN